MPITCHIHFFFAEEIMSEMLTGGMNFKHSLTEYHKRQEFGEHTSIETSIVSDYHLKNNVREIYLICYI